MSCPEALLLLGPTGAGKTPLGEHLEAEGLGGRRCVHFDFGAQLRDVAAGRRRPPAFSDEDVATLAEAVEAGRLLTDEEFPLARGLLEGHLEARRIGVHDLLVLNGLPRHVGQALALAALVDVRTVLQLRATPAAAAERIRGNTGGDREGRRDDGPRDVEARLLRFERETLPLVAHYEERGARIVALEVGVHTGPAEGLRALLS